MLSNSFKKARPWNKLMNPSQSRLLSTEEVSNFQGACTSLLKNQIPSQDVLWSYKAALERAKACGHDSIVNTEEYHITPRNSQEDPTPSGSTDTTESKLLSWMTSPMEQSRSVNSLFGQIYTSTESKSRETWSLPNGDMSSSRPTKQVTSGTQITQGPQGNLSFVDWTTYSTHPYPTGPSCQTPLISPSTSPVDHRPLFRPRYRELSHAQVEQLTGTEVVTATMNQRSRVFHLRRKNGDLQLPQAMTTLLPMTMPLGSLNSWQEARDISEALGTSHKDSTTILNILNPKTVSLKRSVSF